MARRVFVDSPGILETSNTALISEFSLWETTSELPSITQDGSISLIVAPLRLLAPLLRDHHCGPGLLPYGPAERIAQAFLLGARDYVSVPFTPLELLARADRIAYQISLNPSALGSVFEIAGDSIVLTGVQREIFALLMRHTGSIVDREAIDEACGGIDEAQGESRRVDMAMCRLRRALDGYPVSIETVRGRGYRLVKT